jgi:pilus assembly protein CpaF
MICAAVDVIIQTARLRDGSRRVTHVTELLGMEGEVITTQDLLVTKSRARTRREGCAVGIG